MNTRRAMTVALWLASPWLNVPEAFAGPGPGVEVESPNDEIRMRLKSGDENRPGIHQ